MVVLNVYLQFSLAYEYEKVLPLGVLGGDTAPGGHVVVLRLLHEVCHHAVVALRRDGLQGGGMRDEALPLLDRAHPLQHACTMSHVL